MANQLLASCNGSEVGINWAVNLVRRKLTIKSYITWQRDHQRVLCSNLAVISPWFNLVRNVKAKYGNVDCRHQRYRVVYPTLLYLQSKEPRPGLVPQPPRLEDRRQQEQLDNK
jgi:hypothetical protein